jgi:ABC-2 type transport system ATP-binding protein
MVLQLDRLSKRYGTRRGVENLELSVGAGTMFGFLGPNGSGKTTTIRMLLGLLRPSTGHARIFGLDCWRQSDRIKAEVGYLPGDLRLWPWLTCRDALRLFGRARRREILQRGLDLAEHFGLDVDIRVRVMSRGTRQKVGLVLALAHEPRLLILDEPTASLDPLTQETLYKLLRRNVAGGVTVLFSSHTLAEVEDLCSHVAILRDGRLAADASLDKLRARALRRVSVQWRSPEDAARASAAAGVDWIERSDRRWRGEVRGPVADVLRWAAAHPIEDFVLEPPDLRQIFQRIYLGTDGRP